MEKVFDCLAKPVGGDLPKKGDSGKGKEDSCEGGIAVKCPGSDNWCAGEACCPPTAASGGLSFPCPSAPSGWGSGFCSSTEKVWDCTVAETDPTTTAEQPLTETEGPTTTALAMEPPATEKPAEEPPTGDGAEIRLMSWNIWHGNGHFTEIADLIQDQVDPDVVNLQEAVNMQPAAILQALQAKQVGEWKLANELDARHLWCGLNAYRSDRWELEWSKGVTFRDTRGMCGARLRHKASDRKLCVWGAHPAWNNSGSPGNAEEGVREGAAAMKECATDGVVSAFMCDCNTFDTVAVTRQLAKSTGWEWKLAHADGYDHIYIQTARGVHGGDFVSEDEQPHVASVISWQTVAPGSGGGRGCGKECQNPKWAYADHPPVFANVRLE
jgi:hypothetical protein